MGVNGIKEEMSAYLDVLQKGRLTGIDLDALGNCLSNALHLLEQTEKEAGIGRILMEDLVTEIVSLSRAKEALANGVAITDPDKLKEKLLSHDARVLLALRKNARHGFARLLRSGEIPRKTAWEDASGLAYSDYGLEDKQD